MRTLEFFEACQPPRTGSKTNYRVGKSKQGKPMVFKGEGAKESMATWRDIIKDNHPGEQFEGALSLRVELYFPLIGSDTGTKAKRAEIEAGVEPWMTTRPDLTNLCEAIQDCLTKQLVIKDDAQIVMFSAIKKRSPKPGVKIILREIE